MTDWHSPATIEANARSFSNLVYALLGIVAWEWVISLDFDIGFLTGERKFRWPMILYFYARYGYLGGLINFVIIMDSTSEVNCMAAYIICSAIGNTCIGVASINLYLRTMAVWGHNRYIVWPLIILSIGHFGIILRAISNSNSKWVRGSGCVTIDAEPTVFAIMFIYTMVFDLIILVLTGYKLWYLNMGMRYSSVMKLLFTDGLVYFIVAFTVNAIAVIFSLMNLNVSMSLIADIPAMTLSNIAAGRVVRRLSNHVTGGQELSIDSISTIKVKSQSISERIRSKTQAGAHIEMSTFTEQDGSENVQAKQPDLEANVQVLKRNGSGFTY